FVLHYAVDHRDLHSFPTRRSSDLVELRLAKIRPERRRDEQLGVRNLPEQEIADAHLAAGAYQQVRIREASSVKVLGEYLFGDVGGIHFARFDLLGEAADSLDNFGAAAVAKRHDQ